VEIKPIGDKILIEPFDAAEQSRGGIVIPEFAREKQKRGRVVAVGDGRTDKKGNRIPIGVKVDDIILYVGDIEEIIIGGKPYLFIKQDNLVAVDKG
jgi:chaperonin GroES